MLALVLAVTLRLTLPAYHADSTGCAPGPWLLSDLDSLVVEAQPVAPVAPLRRVLILRVRRQEGQALVLTVPLSPDSAYSVRVWTADTRGRRCCPAWLTVGSWPLPVAGLPPGRLEWFDVAGRRVHVASGKLPSPPGVYLWRADSKRGQIVVLR